MSDFAKLIEEFKDKLSKAISSKEVETIRLEILPLNSSINFAKSDIFTDYFLTKEKQ